MPNTSSISRTHATRVREDHVGAALRAAVSKPKNWTRNDRQYINEYSRANGLLWHVGYAEHKSALSQLHARMRVHIERNESELQAEVPAGEFVELNGTKITSEIRAPWNRGVALRPAPAGVFVDGMAHPAILGLIDAANDVGDTAILRKDAKTGKSEIMIIARLGIKERNLIIANKMRDYSTIAVKESEKGELNDQLIEASKRIAKLETKQIEFDARMDEKFTQMRAEMRAELLGELA